MAPWVKAPQMQYSEKPSEPERWPLSLCYPLHDITLLVVLASFTSGDQNFIKSLHSADHNPIMIGD